MGGRKIRPGRRGAGRPEEEPEAAAAHVELDMASALTFGIQARASGVDLFGHCARVARLAARMADEAGLSDGLKEVLVVAARLHELGMVAVPTELLTAERPLTTAELERVRSQAWIGGEIARATLEPRIADLIESQYASLPELERRFSRVSDEYLLAAILRVADAYDAMTHPRPYQLDLPKELAANVLERGAGGLFHPDCVRILLGRGLES